MSTPTENPYQPPATVDTSHDPAFPPEMRIHLFGTPMVLLALVLCTPLPALIMLVINCWRLRWHGLMWGMMVAAAIALATALLPFAFDAPVPVVLVLFLAQYLLVAIVSMAMWHWTRKTRPRGSYRYATYVSAFLTGMMGAAPLVVIMILGTVMLYASRGTPVELSGGHVCYISGDATEDDALFVGQHLLDGGYLDEEGGSTLFLRRDEGRYVLSFAMSPEMALDNDVGNTLVKAGRELADLRLGRPLVVRMVDQVNSRVYWRATIAPKGDDAGESKKDTPDTCAYSMLGDGLCTTAVASSSVSGWSDSSHDS